MRKLNCLVVMSCTVLFSSCTFEKKKPVEVKTADMIGQWDAIHEIADSEISEYGLISKIDLKKDLTAEVEIRSSKDSKIIPGSWGYGDEKRLGPLTFQTDGIVLTLYFKNEIKEKERIVFLRVKVQDEKLILINNEIDYIKKESSAIATK